MTYNTSKILITQNIICAIDSKDHLSCWLNRLIDYQMVIEDQSDNRIKDIQSGKNNTCILDYEGEIRCFYFNTDTGIYEGIFERELEIPNTVQDKVYQVKVGHTQICVILFDNSIICWNYLDYSNEKQQYDNDYNFIELYNNFVRKWSQVRYIEFNSSVRCYVDGSNNLQCKSRIIQLRHLMSDVDRVYLSMRFICAINYFSKVQCWDANLLEEISYFHNINSMNIINLAIMQDTIVCVVNDMYKLQCFDIEHLVFDNYILASKLKQLNFDNVQDVTINKNQMCLIITDHQLTCIKIPKLVNSAILPLEVRMKKISQAVTHKNISCVISKNIYCWYNDPFKNTNLHSIGVPLTASKHSPKKKIKFENKNAVSNALDSAKIKNTLIKFSNQAYKYLSIGTYIMCAIDDIDNLQCWKRGQIGSKLFNTRLSIPDKLEQKVNYVSTESNTVCVVLLNLHLSCWYQQFDHRTLYWQDRSYPSQRTDGLSVLGIPSSLEKNIKKVVVGDPAICVLTEKENSLYCWTNINIIGKYVNLKLISKDVQDFNLARYMIQIKLIDGRFSSVHLQNTTHINNLSYQNSYYDEEQDLMIETDSKYSNINKFSTNGWYHCAIYLNREFKCWTENEYDTHVPWQLNLSATDVSVAPGHACATDTNMRVFCWSHFKQELVVEKKKGTVQEKKKEIEEVRHKQIVDIKINVDVELDMMRKVIVTEIEKVKNEIIVE